MSIFQAIGVDKKGLPLFKVTLPLSQASEEDWANVLKEAQSLKREDSIIHVKFYVAGVNDSLGELYVHPDNTHQWVALYLKQKSYATTSGDQESLTGFYKKTRTRFSKDLEIYRSMNF